MENMIANRYMVVTSLGEGGMADVYLAIDTILNREVAVKVLRGELSKDPVTLLRFQREANAASKLAHPNVVEVYDVGEADGRNYIVMEYVRGRTLKQLIQQRGALHKEEAVNIMKQLVSAVAHAHDNNIIHRDIKPQNVLIKDDGTVKITDFGIALAHDAVQLTQSDSVLGSAHYLAPETTRGEQATNQIDIYALGIVFYELLTGDVPFRGDNPVQIAMKHLREDIPSVKEFNPTLPQSIENIIIKATAKNRVFRYKSAKEMLYDLENCLLPDFLNAPKVVFDDAEGDETRVLQRIGDANNNNPIKEEKQKMGTLQKLLTGLIITLSLVGIVVLVYFSGVIKDFSPVKYVNVPALEGKTAEEAAKLLTDSKLTLDTKYKYDLSDKYEEGMIINSLPAASTQVEEGSSVVITISTAKSYEVQNYVGWQVDDVKSTFSNAGVNIDVRIESKVEKGKKAGEILEQSLLAPGTKVDPTKFMQIKFVVAADPEFVLPANVIGMKIEDAKKALEAKGGKVELSVLPVKDFTEEEIEVLEKEVVIKMTPEINTLYKQSEDNVITLYYYKKAK
ncbi:MAG: Stk1 family PASTA domain-containing Ser/Thr kinase [Erysipelotrichaceae bacterium]